jgi:predicted nucleic-acid-binding protein
MIALDTNILARYYVIDAADTESARQHAEAVNALSGKARFFVPKTVLLELEWVLRGFYGQTRGEILRVFDHLLALPMMRIEDDSVVSAAIDAYRAGLDFADALHHASAHGCEQFLTFDNRGFVRPAAKMKLQPKVVLPESRTS